jgi:hypothetical protein
MFIPPSSRILSDILLILCKYLRFTTDVDRNYDGISCNNNPDITQNGAEDISGGPCEQCGKQEAKFMSSAYWDSFGVSGIVVAHDSDISINYIYSQRMFVCSCLFMNSV